MEVDIYVSSFCHSYCLQLAEKEVDTSCQCQPCGKRFSTANAYENHLKSKKHREAVAHGEGSLPSDVEAKNAKNKELTAKSTAEKRIAEAEARNNALRAMQVSTSTDCELGELAAGPSGISVAACAGAEAMSADGSDDAGNLT
jgi:hypothetical protein